MVFKTTISRIHLENSTVQNTPLTTHSLRHALMACKSEPSCSCVCDEGTGKDFILSNLYVVREFIDNSPGEKLACYTDRKRMLYPSEGVVLTGDPPSPPSKSIELLKDGIYDNDIDSCYHAKCMKQAHILLEFPEVTRISSVVVRSQPKGNVSNKLLSVEARIGNITSGGKLTDYIVLDSFVGPPDLDTDIVFKGKFSIWGKFVSLQEVSSFSRTSIIF